MHCSGDARYAGIHSSDLSAVGVFSFIIKGGGGVVCVCVCVCVRERERIQLTDTEFSVSFCVQFINCLKWRIQILFWWDFFSPDTKHFIAEVFWKRVTEVKCNAFTVLVRFLADFHHSSSFFAQTLY